MTMCDYCRHDNECMQPQWHISAVNNGDRYCEAFKSWLKRNISMAYVTPSFVTNNKSVTRRDWADVTIRQFKNETKALVWNKQSRFGGEPIGVLELTKNPFKQNTSLMLPLDYVAEGFKYLDEEYSKHHHLDRPLMIVIDKWRESCGVFSVVPFKIVEVFPGMEKKYTTDEEIIRCVKALEKAIG